MSRLRQEFGLACLAVGFLTRLPVPETQFSEARLNASSRYFPLVGVLVAALIGAVFLLTHYLFASTALALLLALVSGLLITGAFHEDGFADFCDGFGGGWRRDQVLSIMKDSRIGTYGVAGLVMLLAVKFAALWQLPVAAVFPALLLGHAWSRLASISLLLDLSYVRGEGTAKPLSTTMSTRGFAFALLSVAPLALWLSAREFALIIAALLLFRWWFRAWLKRRIGGYTGDCLGAAQQVAEVLIYLCLLLHIQ